MSDPGTTRLPASLRVLGRVILRPFLAADERDDALAAVQELYALRRHLSSPLAARLYGCRQLLQFIPRLAAERLGSAHRRNTFPHTVPGGLRSMSALLHDIRYVVRTLLRAPGYAGVIVVTLAICIGANTAIYTVIRSVLLDPLPYPEPERIVGVWMTSLPEVPRLRVTPGNYTALRERTEIFEALAGFSGTTASLALEDGEVIALRGGQVTGEYLRVLGVRPRLGRDFVAEELEQGGPAVTLLSHALWASRFGADPRVVGRTVTFNGASFEVVGVLPPGLYPMSQSIAGDIPLGVHDQEFLVPLRYSAALYTNRRPHILGVVGRLRDGVTVEQAAATVTALGDSLAAEDSQNDGEGFLLTPFREAIVGRSRGALVVLMASVGLVLLIAATNIASLMLARADGRRAELAVRGALGAPRGRLVRLLVCESLLLTALGGGSGVALALWALARLDSALPVEIPRLETAVIDVDVLAFTAATALLTAALSGLAPALRATRSEALGALRQSAAGLAGDRDSQRLNGHLLALQIALAVVLTVGAGLLTRTFWSLRSVDMGFRPARVWTVPLSLPGARYSSPEELWAFQRLVRERLAAVPGVAAAGLAYDHPLDRTWEDAFEIEARAVADDDRGGASLRPIGEGYLEAAGVTLVAGRAILDSDDNGAPGVMLINDALAQRYFPGADPIGERLRIPTAQRFWGDAVPESWEIVGVVADVRFMGPDAAPQPAMYPSILQFPTSNLEAIVRLDGSAGDPIAALRRAFRELDGELATVTPLTLDGLLAAATARQRFGMFLVGAFAAVGLLLAAMGTWGLVSRAAAARAQEIGIRVALGAPGPRLAARLLRGALAPASAGIAIGLSVAAVLARFVQGLLFGVTALDPWTYTGAPLLLLVITIAAGGLPAIRGARRDPATVLRGD